ncbi:MAG: zf-HC2 domain-containing protein [Acidobacteriia bacterium]|nr:zf-HC2 domain-containing protein [Terriglobia bacterium]
MDCRTFHRKLEDYLGGGLDFPARFGMERHAKQCFACEKVVTDALKLRQMAQSLRRVGAPADFEASLQARIRGASSQRRFWTLRSLWIYGLEGWSWRVASATALITVMIVVAASYVYFGGKLERLTAPQVAMGTLNTAPLEKDAGQPSSENRLISDADLSSSLGKIPPFDAGRGNWAKPLAEPADSEYVDVFVPIAGDQKLVLRLPKTIRMRNEQPSGEYFIRSISY